MVQVKLARRDFSKLATAAFAGIAVGSLAVNLTGCSNQPGGSSASGKPETTVTAPVSAKTASTDANACAGLNGCKGHGADGKNACAGQGGCASAAMKHDCKGKNACKGQGGCGEKATENACKGQGGCAVPMKDKTAWQKARDKFESKMKAEGKEFGSAPKKA